MARGFRCGFGLWWESYDRQAQAADKGLGEAWNTGYCGCGDDVRGVAGYLVHENGVCRVR